MFIIQKVSRIFIKEDVNQRQKTTQMKQSGKCAGNRLKHEFVSYYLPDEEPNMTSKLHFYMYGHMKSGSSMPREGMTKKVFI